MLPWLEQTVLGRHTSSSELPTCQAWSAPCLLGARIDAAQQIDRLESVFPVADPRLAVRHHAGLRHEASVGLARTWNASGHAAS